MDGTLMGNKCRDYRDEAGCMRREGGGGGGEAGRVGVGKQNPAGRVGQTEKTQLHDRNRNTQSHQETGRHTQMSGAAD
jgi:hypothetical protein